MVGSFPHVPGFHRRLLTRARAHTKKTSGLTPPEGIPAVVDRAVSSLTAVKEARAEICGAAEPLDGLVAEVARLTGALALVKAEADFQTEPIRERAREIMVLSARLVSSMLVMVADKRHRLEPRVLRPGDREYSHLEAMLGQLRDQRKALEALMLAAQVGLRGSRQDGFRVSRRTLVDVNERVKEMFGADLAIFTRLRDLLEAQTGKPARASPGVRSGVVCVLLLTDRTRRPHHAR